MLLLAPSLHQDLQQRWKVHSKNALWVSELTLDNKRAKIWKSTKLPSDLVSETPSAKHHKLQNPPELDRALQLQGEKWEVQHQKCGHSSNKTFQQTLHSWQKLTQETREKGCGSAISRS